MKSQTEFRIGPGMASLLMILVTLLMAALAILAWAGAQTDSAFSGRSREAVESYYAAAAQVQQTLFEVDQLLADARRDTEGNLRAYAQRIREIQSKYPVDEAVDEWLDSGEVSGGIEETDEALDGWAYAGGALDNLPEAGEALGDLPEPDEVTGGLPEPNRAQGGLPGADEAQGGLPGAGEAQGGLPEAGEGLGGWPEANEMLGSLPEADEAPGDRAEPDTDEDGEEDAAGEFTLRLVVPIGDDRYIEAILEIMPAFTGPRYALVSHKVVDAMPWDGAQELDLYTVDTSTVDGGL